MQEQHSQDATIVWVEDTSFHGDTTTRRRLRRGPVKNNSTGAGNRNATPPAPPTTPITRMDPRLLVSSPIIHKDTSSLEGYSLCTPSESSSSGIDSNNYHRGGVLLETAAATKLTGDLPNGTHLHHHVHASSYEVLNDRMGTTGSMDVPTTPPDMAHGTMPLHTTTGVMWVPVGLPTTQSFLQANMGALDLLAEDPVEEDKDEEEEGPCEDTVNMEPKTSTSTTEQDPSLLRLRNKRGSRRSTSFPTQTKSNGTIPPMPFLFD